MITIKPTRLLTLLTAALFVASAAMAQYEASRVFSFIQDTYNRRDKNLNEFLIGEINDFIDLFPEHEKTAEAQYLLAMVYEAKGDKHEALMSHCKTVLLYTASDQRLPSIEAARKIIANEKAYAGKGERLLAALEASSADDSAADRYYAYLELLVDLDQSDLREWSLPEIKRFIRRFPEDGRIDMALGWSADLLEKKGSHREAAAAYLKLEYAYPQSALLSYSRYSRAVILYKELGENQKAVEALNQVVADSADSVLVGSSLFLLGEIKQRKLKDYKGAIADYRTLIDSQPGNAKAIEALFAVAEINSDKLSAHTEAIAVYDEIVGKFGQDERSIKALQEAAELYKSKLNDAAKAAASYAKIAGLFPYYEKAPDMLLRAGGICEDKLKDYKKAIEYYQAVVEKFPDHRMAGEAKKRIEKAQQKAAP
jgi:TolA-binding protein